MSAKAVLRAVCILLCMAHGVAGPALSGDVSVQALADRDSVSLGEPFLFQIKVDGTDAPPSEGIPDLKSVGDFSVEPLGIRTDHRSPMAIVNGKVSRVDSPGYVISYRLTPRKAGEFVFPPITLSIDSMPFGTQPVMVRVTQPEEDEDFKLRLEFSKTRFYVGEPVVLTVVWTIGRDVESFAFSLPFLTDPNFTFVDPLPEKNSGGQPVRIDLGRQVVSGEKGGVALEGRNLTTLSFRKVFTARSPGTFQFPEATVWCRTSASRAMGGNTALPFDRFLGDRSPDPGPGKGSRTCLSRWQPPRMEVLALPEEGKPGDFSGQVGHFQISTWAAPAEVAVGDPITLTCAIRGSPVPQSLELPSLVHDPAFTGHFKIPEDAAAGVVKDGAKVFTQTIRPTSPSVSVIPPVRFVYFDPDLGEYRAAVSETIPIRVRSARIVAEDAAEGSREKDRERKELRDWSLGIAHNYEGPQVLENQRFSLSSALRSPMGVAGLAGPLLLYFTLLVIERLHWRRRREPAKYRAMKAFSSFRRKVDVLSPMDGAGVEAEACGKLMSALQGYFGDKLHRLPESLTPEDILDELRKRGVSDGAMRQLAELFQCCEREIYGGGGNPAMPLERLSEAALEVVRDIDKRIL